MDDEQAKSNDQSPEHPSPSEPPANSSQAASPWDVLARTLGVEPSPESLERPHLENAPPHQESTIPEKQPLPESSETPSLQQNDVQTGNTKTSDWGKLTAELGITIDDPSEPTIVAPASVGGDQDGVPSSQPPITAVPREDKPREETPPEAWGDLPSFQEEEPAQVAFTNEPILTEDELDESDSPVEEGLSGEVARSVFDALFLSGTAAAEALGNLLPSRESGARKRERTSTDQQTDPEQGESEQGESEQGIEDQDALLPGERPEKSASRRGTGRRRGRRRRGRDGESEKDTQSQREEPRDDSSEEREIFSTEGDDEPPKSNARRRRPRRRRGRGPGVATRETDNLTTSREKELSSAPGSESAASGDGTDDSTSEWKEDAPRAHRNRQEPPASEDADQKDVTGEDVTGEEVTGEEGKSGSRRESSSKRPSHRNIPTWEESMSVIVDSNIEARKNSPSPAGRSGSSRSRGRGGRRRKKT